MKENSRTSKVQSLKVESMPRYCRPMGICLYSLLASSRLLPTISFHQTVPMSPEVIQEQVLVRKKRNFRFPHMKISNRSSIFEKGMIDNVIKGKVTLIYLHKSKGRRAMYSRHLVLSNDIIMWIKTNAEGKDLCPFIRF